MVGTSNATEYSEAGVTAVSHGKMVGTSNSQHH